ncbi:MAG: zf-TFIIB domain-containing protein [Paenibacillus macerans]|uniref:TFIIB-type zinc ribbon-containing protein n=1 Tax=Paenibacillus macerans TaxID=44252 RepID=UPI002913C330|nr:zf-TFIIB domain-containing protein [Paenibacillus macerans]MDU7473360.1 zf-TFIIB domain-containing protein [Paenibacillus macerans]
MKCPVCNDVRMREVEKDGVLIDVCPDCKGVWLDRGELEKLMSEVREIRPAFNEWYERDYDRPKPKSNEGYGGYPQQGQQGYDPRYSQHGYDKHYKHKKKKSLLDVFGDLFD